MFLNVDYDGTLTPIESGIEIAKIIGRENEAKLSCKNLLFECERFLDKSKTAQELEKDVEASCNYHLKEGASWLKGYPSSILSEIQCPPTAYAGKILSMIKENGGVKIISRTDRRIVENFLDKFEETKDNRKIVCNELKVDKKGYFTGGFSKIISKGRCYSEGDVIGDSVLDIGLFNKANKKSYKVYLVENGDKTDLARKALEKFKIPFSTL